MHLEQLLFQENPRPMWVYDPDTLAFLDVNEAAVERYGYSRARFLDMTIQDIRPPEDRPHVARASERPGTHLRDRTWRHLTADGDIRMVEIVSQPLEHEGRPARLITVFDVTRRVRAEEELRRSEDRYKILFESAPVGVVSVDREGRLLRTNPAFQEMLGYTEEELADLELWDITHPEDQGASRNTLGALSEGTSDRVSLEKRYLTREGEPVWVRITAAAVRDEDGQLVRTVTMVEDVGERRGARARIREQREFFEQILETIDLDIATFDTEGRFEYVNRQSAGDRGVRDWMRGKTNEEYARTRKGDEELGRRRHQIILEAIETGEVRELEEVVPGSDGRPRFFLRRHCPVTDDEGRVERVVGYGVDRTEWKEAQDALRESQRRLQEAQKMEAVGRLAGGVAHEFNNLLTVITGHAELLVDRLGRDGEPSVGEDLARIQEAAGRAGGLVRQLLAFGRGQRAAFEVLGMEEIVRENHEVIRKILGPRIELEIRVDPDAPRIRGDRGQLEQVLMNLVLNARDAMPDGGTLMLGTQAREDGEWGGEEAVLVVEDTGTGMAPDVRARIFDPFFTTKPRGKGTGLGLSAVYGIVELHGGRISVDTREGGGTAFRLFLPPAGVEAGVG